jgi:diaminohydroxyphosphoribosylaminopyrimidine deaminase/5-amino-6-(5-phosphoribosylamino)uracil reductase
MAAALTLASRGLGRVWPNPAVGCVIVKDGHVVGRGWTQPGGRPHAETEALTRAGGHAKGATAYISLEPCSHHGETPPCAEALIAAGIARAVIACPDPDPRVSGQGATMLQAAGVDVVADVLRADAERLNRGFFLRVGEGRPMVTLKVAASLDGRVATASGDSKWITAEPARRLGHLLRATHDGIAVGSGTVAADNPSLTCRLSGMAGRSPVRVVFSSSGKVELSSKLVRGAGEVPTWTVMTVPASDDHRKALEAAGVQVIDVGDENGRRIDIRTALDQLAERGLTRLLLEGGSRLSTAFVRAGLVDRIAWFTAPRLLGGDGLPALGDLGIGKVADSLELEPVDVIAAGPDILRIFDVARRAQAEG